MVNTTESRRASASARMEQVRDRDRDRGEKMGALLNGCFININHNN